MQSSETEDRWYVDVGGTPKMMTLDELVEAFEGGIITAKTLVTEVGGTEWKPLKEVADLGDEDEAPPPSVQAAAQPAPSVLPAPPVQRVSAAPLSANRESAWPPAAAWSQAPARSGAPAPWSQAPLASRPSAPVSLGPNSTIPVVADLGPDLDDMAFQKRRSKAPFIAAAAVVLLGGIGFAAMKSGAAAPAPVPTPAAQPIEFQKTVVTPIPTSAPSPAATETAKAESEKEEDKADAKKGLSDDVKAQLLSKDKEREAKKKSSRKGTRGPARSAKNSGGSGVFRAGGDASDPLNSKL